jgi:hypothetical protein
MKLEEQVCNLELSKKFKELDLDQDSLFYWIRPTDNGKHGPYVLLYKDEVCWDICCGHNPISAFTVAELGEMLEEYIIFEFRTVCNEWRIDFGDQEAITGETEIEVRAKMLIYLMENKLI